MEAVNIHHNHPDFFDLAYVRQTASDIGDMSDDDLIRVLVDPDNRTPPNPNYIFDTAYYARNYVLGADNGPVNPILHYFRVGAANDAAPHALFDPLFFARNLRPDDAKGQTLVERVLAKIETGRVAFHPFIDVAFIQRTYGLVLTKQVFQDLFDGQLDIAQSHPLFDVSYIREMADRDIKTLSEAIDWYWKCGFDAATHALFDVEFYKAQLPCEETVSHAVYHYLISSNPVSPQPLLDTSFYRESVLNAGECVPERALEHFVTEGQSLDLNPSPFFDVAHYRALSNCGPDALQHYLSTGHTQLSPHPLVRADEDRVFACTLPQNDLPVAVRLACCPTSVALSVTPDVDTVFLDWISKAKDSDPFEVRSSYFQKGYIEGKRPNGLLTLPYVAARLKALHQTEEPSFSAYFRHGLHQCKRIMIALEDFDNTPENRGWLAVLKNQISNADVEFIVVGRCGGSMISDFCEAAHVWLLSNDGETRASFRAEAQSSRRLFEVVSGNAPLAILTDAASSAELRMAMSQFDGPLILLGDAGLVATDHDDVLPLVCEMTPAAIHTARVLADPVDIRTKLGLPHDAIVVLGSGPLDIIGSSDLFGAVAGRCLEHPDCPPKVHFIWHGTGAKFPNTPAFYATYFVASVADADRISIIDAPDLQDVAASADIYLKFCRDSADMGGVAEAKAAGLAIVMSCDPAKDADKDTTSGRIFVNRFDIQAATNALVQLTGVAHDRLQISETTQQTAQTDDGLSYFIDQMNDLFVQSKIDIQLCPPISVSPSKTLLIVADEDVFDTFFSDHTNAGTYREQDIVSIDRSLLDPESPFSQTCGSLDLAGKSRVIVCKAGEGLSGAFVDEFGRSVWLLKGLLAQMDDVYRLGLSFDEIKVMNPRAIDDMAALNPKIANTMSVFRKAAP